MKCEYGCDQEANYQLENGRWCCSIYYQRCPAIRVKNKNGVTQCYKRGRDARIIYFSLSKEAKDKMSWSRGLTKDTDERVKRTGIAISQSYKSGKNKPHRTPHSEQTKKKLSITMSEKLKNSEFRKNYGRGKKSWMEEQFEVWLNKSGVKNYKAEQHFWNPVLKKNYFVDFLFDDKKIIIELDGTQHRRTKQYDYVRDDYLKSIGFKVFRIEHSEFLSRFYSDRKFSDILGH